MAARAKVQGLRTPEGACAVRLALDDGSISPLVLLFPARDGWRCECPRGAKGCAHAAAAVQLLEPAPRKDPLDLSTGRATVRYELTDDRGSLAMRRVVRRGSRSVPLGGRLAAARRPADLVDVDATRADLELDILLRTHTHGPLSAPMVQRILEQLKQADDVLLGGKPAKIGDAVHLTSAAVVDTKTGFLIETGPTPEVTKTFRNGAVMRGNVLCAAAESGLSDRDLAALREGKAFDFGDAAELVNTVIPALEQRLPVHVRSKLLPTAKPMAPRVSLSSQGVDGKVKVLASLVYGDPPSARVEGTKLVYLGGDLPLRDVEREQALRHSLWREAALEVGEEKTMEAAEAVELSKLAARVGESSFAGKGPRAFTTHGALSVDVKTTDDGAFDVRFTTEDGREGDADIVLNAWRARQDGRSAGEAPLVPLMDGGFAELPEDWLAKHGQLVLDLLRARQEQQGKLPKASLLDLALLMERLNRPPPPELQTLRDVLDEAKEGLPAEELPEEFTGELRDYQHEGVRWLQFLSRSEIGALLADDMGLGKTVQALCAVGSPTLVVCPASVLFNWTDEIRKFRPDLRSAVYHQQGRKLDDKADLTLTTYAILRLDREILAEREWDTVILDEAHTIKNPQSQVAQAAFALRARFRIGLTGTPVENRLEDLWSQMHFLNRGLLGGRRDFQERYSVPITSGDKEVEQRLRQRVRPLILRRLKGEVAAELPPRTDIVLHCELSEAERARYDAVRAATRSDVVAQLSAGRGVMAALEALLRLRQACCHPSLLPGEEAEDSSKLQVLREQLDEVLSEGHKALVFSQWTSLLDLVEPGLDAAGVRYTRLDGSTRNREDVVKAFQEDEDVHVMLLSLKAGGVGLNLTAADHVFLLDPWWNPAVEDQAADRAHRIGQDRPVFVHRLVAENTVEERILELQEKKRALASAATESGVQGAGLTRDDLLGLLE